MARKKLVINCTVFIVMLLAPGRTPAQDNNWTHFRGSDLNGIANTGNIPLKWDESSVKWKTAIHDRGLSSPIVFGNQVWLTTASADGRELYAVCIDYETGKIIHDIKVFSPEKVEGKHNFNSYATPTPSIEKGFVYVHYGSGGTACINTSNGSIVWKNNDYSVRYVQGPASSPVIYKDLLILHFEGTDARFIVGLDKATGKQVWKTDRPDEPYRSLTSIGRKAYVTPLIINFRSRDMLITNGSAVCQALDPASGREIWRVVGGAESTISMPVTEDGILYWYNGYIVDDRSGKYSEFVAVNPDGKGDITSTNLIWKKTDPLTNNQMLTPVIKDGLIYTVTTRNILMCIDARTGSEIWTTRLMANYNASPIYLNGNIWLFSVRGDVITIKAGRKYEVVAENKMESGIWATPAFLRNSVILRTDNFLYRIGK